MVALGLVLLCFQAAFLNGVLSQAICSKNIPANAASTLALSNLGASTAAASLLSRGAGSVEPLTITKASFTPISSIANPGLIDATISQVVPNLQFGDITLSGDLPIGGTIKVSGCFPVYGMVELDGVVPSCGTASAGPSVLPQGNCVC